MRRFFKWLGIGFGVLVVAVGVLIAVWDWNWFRGYADRAGSRASGREFAIDGDIDVDLGWTSRVRLERVRLGNAEWAKDPNMLEIGLLEFTIKLGDLLRGRVVLPELYFGEPKLRLERNKDGAGNWEISPASPGGAAVEATVPEKRTEFPVIGQLRIEKGTLSYDAPADQIAIEATVDTATGEGGSGAEEVRLNGKGNYAKEPFVLKLRAGSLLSLREGNAPYPVSVDAKIGKTSIQADGSAAEPLDMEGLDFKFSVKGANMADLFPIFRIPLPKTPPYSLTGRLTEEKDLWRFEDFAGRMGDSDLSGDLSYQAREDKRPLIRATLVSNRLDFDDLAGLIGATPGSGRGGKSKQQARKGEGNRGRVLPDAPVDLERLRAADMDVRFQGKRIRYPDLPIQNMDARFRLEQGRLQVEPLKFGVANGSVAGSLVLDGRKNTPYVAANLALHRLDLKAFFAGTEQAGVTSGKFGGRVELAGSGKSVAQILGTSNGHVGLTMAGGQISNLVIELAGIDVAEALPRLLGSDKPVQIRCVVGDFGVKDGLMRSNVLVFDTTDTNVTGEAAVNLRDESLNLRLEAHPKDMSPLVGRTPITVTGTLGHPQVGIDPSGLVARGAAAVALGALLTPLAAIIPLIELGLGEDSDCAGLIQQANRRK